MKVRFKYDWGRHFDWIIIPTIMIGFRPYGIGIAILVLKMKINIHFYWRYSHA